jgi:hypothetical protein
MRALIAGGASDRSAAEIVGAEQRIPASTLRKYLAKSPEAGGGVFFDNIQFDISTAMDDDEIYRRHMELQQKKREEPSKSPTDKAIEMLQSLHLLGPQHPKKKRK